MDLTGHLDAFAAVVRALVSSARQNTHERCLAAKQAANANGMLHSSRTVLAVEREAVETFEESLATLHGEFASLTKALQPRPSDAERPVVLAAFVEAAADVRKAVYVATLEQVESLARHFRMDTVVFQRLDTRFDELADASAGRARLALAADRHSTPSAMTTNNIHAHGQQVIVQTGANCTATMTVTSTAQVSAADVAAAVAELSKALAQLQGIDEQKRTTAVAVLTEVKRQAESDSPNAFAVQGVIGTLRDSAELLQAAPAAIATLISWGSVVLGSVR